MEHILPTDRPIKDYTKKIVVKKNDVPKVVGKSSYRSVKPVLDAVVKNFIGMLDDRGNIYGKLHLVTNTSQMSGEPSQQVV